MHAKEIALGGLLAALAVVVMLMGGIVPLAMYVCPMLASMLLIPLRDRLSLPLRLSWYAAVALLSLLLCPDQECAMLFAVLGYYPILQPWLDRLPLALRLLLKLLLVVAAVVVMYALLLFVFQLQSLRAELRELQLWLGLATVGLSLICFFVYDRLLVRLTQVYLKRRKK